MVEFSVLVCCSTNDVDYLFDRCIHSIIKHVKQLKSIYIVTPFKVDVQNKLSYDDVNLIILEDKDILNEQELGLCGWSKQQIIKLKSNDFICENNILVVGADTILLKDLNINDLYQKHHNAIYFRQHKIENKHYLYEIERCRNINQLLQVTSNAKHLLDYIFDIFLFKKSILEKLRYYLECLYGKDYFCSIFPHQVENYNDMVKIGEWTLYNLFIINVLKDKFHLKNGTDFLHQIHNHRDLKQYSKSHTALHFVRKDFDIKSIDIILNSND